MKFGCKPAPIMSFFFFLCGLKYTNFRSEQPQGSAALAKCPCLCLYFATFEHGLIHIWASKIGVEKPRRAGYKKPMTNRLPPLDQPGFQPKANKLNQFKSLNRQSYLSTTVWGLGFGGAGLVIAVGLIWLWRIQLAEHAVLSLLRERGIEGDISFIKLSANQAVIKDLRLGSAQSPTLVMPVATMSWHVAIPSGKLVLDHFEAPGAQLRVRLTDNGEIDLGALKPFLVPSDKPSQVELGQISFPDAQIWFLTPSGTGVARIQASGGDQQGWRAHILLTPPNQPAGSTMLALDQPLSVGLGLRAGVVQPDGSRTPTQIGLAVRPNGQSLTLNGFTLSGLRGFGAGLIVLDGKGGVDIQTREAAFSADSLRGANFEAQLLSFRVQPSLWRHVQTASTGWSQAGFGTAIASLQAQGLQQLTGPQGGRVSAKSADLQLSFARTKTGLTRLDMQGDFKSLLGPVQAKSAQLKGRVQADLKDLRALAGADWVGYGALTGAQMAIASQPSAEPISGAVGLGFIVKDAGKFLALNGPLTGSLTSGFSLEITPDTQRPPVFRALPASKPNGGVTYEADGAADVKVLSPISGEGRARIEAFNWSQAGWSLAGRAMALQNFALPGKWQGTSLSGQIDRLDLRALGKAVPTGSGQGRLQLAARAGTGGLGLGAGRVSLAGEVRGDGKRLNLIASGPVEGFGKRGPGVRRGQFKLAAQAQSNDKGWAIDFSSDVGAQAFKSADLSFSALSGKLAGRLGSKNGRSGAQGWTSRTQLDVSVDQLVSKDYDLNQARLTGPLQLFGDTQSLSGTWNLSARAAGVRVGDVLMQDLVAQAPMQLEADLKRSGNWQANVMLSAQADQVRSGESQILGLQMNGPIIASADWDKPILIQAENCLSVQAQSGTFPGEARVGPVSTKACPDAYGRLARFDSTGPLIFANIQFEPLDLQLGSEETGRSIKLGAVKGDFRSSSKGVWALDLTSQDAGFSFKLPDGALATIHAQDARLRVNPDPAGIVLRARAGGLRATGLPVQIAGNATTDLQVRKSGLIGTLAFENLLVRDVPAYLPDAAPTDPKATPPAVPTQGPALGIEKPARFAMLSLTGEGTIQGSQIDIQSDISLAASDAFLARAILNHNTQTGLGRLDAISQTIRLGQAPISRTGRTQDQPVSTVRPLDVDDMIPALQGVILDAVGDVTGSASMAWSPGQTTTSQATVSTDTLDFATLLGQVVGVSGSFNLDDVWQVRSSGPQRFSVRQFDPGLPIRDMNIEFSLPGTNNLDLIDASWPFGDGKMSVRPASWTFRDGDQSFYVDVESVDLAELLRLTNIPDLKIDAKVSGVFPIEVRNGSVEIVGGRLTAPPGGGKIRYSGPGSTDLSAANAKKLPWYRKLIRIQPLNPPSKPALLAEGIEYDILQINVDGRITGDLTIAIVLQGANAQVLSGVPVKLTVKAKLPLGQITDMANQFIETATNANMIKELDKLDRAQNGKGFLPEPSVPAAPVIVSPLR